MAWLELPISKGALLGLQAQCSSPSEAPPPRAPVFQTWRVKPCIWQKPPHTHTCQVETQAENAQDTQRQAGAVEDRSLWFMSSMNMCREHKPSLTVALPMTQPPGGPQHSSEGAHSFLHGLCVHWSPACEQPPGVQEKTLSLNIHQCSVFLGLSTLR